MHIERQVGKQKPFPSEHIILNSEQIGTTEICRQEHPEAFRKHKMLKDHFLLFVLEGKHEVLIADKKYVINKGEMFLLKKATYAEFVKTGNPDNHFIYESVSFSLKKEIIIDFVKLIEMEGYAQNPASEGEVLIHPYGARLQSFLESLKPYFDDNEEIKVGLFKLKILELLYDLAHANSLFLQQLMSLNYKETADLLTIMETHYLEPRSVSDLAYISGRSLSSFRREFESLFRTTPARWIQEKRLQKARELFLTTSLSIADVCYEVGYENMSHFSRLYKSHFGYNPSETRKETVAR
ncbi:helix-turn-helix domain-containing protein [Elizabethkingia meningoseptica]|uniref:helix-turn-helix domain-containing protein n=1 Tax=Elizabethkingia meningoseptica TaxID=238 RepID=UPI000B35E3BE|nr:helix-turn-helix domain-containing protein [Elizabethkingia meningoseptica]MDE5437500.1 helix-turn-helix domain-containing protein [Elizabethkingia meningoseptica]MDE5491032.1 helix-turn-helix domain-containing protein [Elizabethkingia meningoseptica]MDE5507402.1 helix-turn-helix domain-containing protein [Elizabethkingia meningoseptica]MDE5515315.1 helix-turn-helix domain-containing protein [Elizabethkingia meningoseptica]MDE5526297.1 helix-turn-helix domain-containing protein [Elizabethki